MKVGIKYISSEFKKFAEKHSMIGQYIDNPKTEGDFDYSLMMVEFNSLNLMTGSATIPISVFFLDRLSSDESNLMDVLDDQSYIANDFFSYFNENESKFKFYIDSESPLEPTGMDFNDNLAGWRLDTTVTVRNFRNELAIPFKDE